MQEPELEATLTVSGAFQDAIHAPGTEGEALPAPTRDPTGRFLPGEQWAGNSKGRAKGVKNRITLQRLLLEEDLRERLQVNAPALLAKAVQMAMEGNPKIMQVLLDKLIASPKNAEDDQARDTAISVTINDLSGSTPVAVSKGQQTLTINGDGKGPEKLTPRVIEHSQETK